MVAAPYVSDLLARVCALRSGLARPVVVGISGHGGAGKSTLARRVAGELGIGARQVVTLDRMYAAGGRAPGGLRDLHDWAAVATLLEGVRTCPGERLAYPTRQWTGEEGHHDVPMPSVVLVEGIRLLWPDTVGWFDLSVWIDLDPERAGARGVARNRRQGDDDAELDLWRTRWVPEGTAYEREAQPARLADLVVPAHV